MLKGEKQKSKKKQRGQNGGLLFNQGDDREQALSIQKAKEIFKNSTSRLAVTQETAELAGAVTAEIVVRNGERRWKV